MKNRLSFSRPRVSLQRALSKLGYCSRSGAVAIIQAGRVTVSGRVVTDPSFRVSLDRPAIRVEGIPASVGSSRTIALHKPSGLITTSNDELGRRTVVDLLGVSAAGLKPVGRLDMGTTGLLLLTSDHRLLDRLTDPEVGVEKEYNVLLDRPLTAEDLRSVRGGLEIPLPGGVYRTRAARIFGAGPNRYRIVLHEGKNRQIRRMMSVLGREVVELQRTRFGPVLLGNLPVGEWRVLTNRERDALARAAGMQERGR